MILKALVAACGALLLLCGWFWFQNGNLTEDVERQRKEIASLERSVATLEEAVTQSRLAADVAKAVAERERAVSAQYERLRDNLRNGGNDAEIPCWFSNYVNSILGRLPEGRCSD